jgi:cytosine/adenosine deaminase-related metal-dependent hydrolase
MKKPSRNDRDPVRLTVIVHADMLVCMDTPRREIADGAVAFRGGEIVAIGTTADLARLIGTADEVVQARG